MNSSTFGISSKPKRKKRKYIKQSQKPPPSPKYEPENNTLPRSFPLHFNASQSSSNNNRNDLYQGINKQTKCGLDKLVFRSGRNVKRLWVRLVAGGDGSLMDDSELSDSDDEEDKDDNNPNNNILKKEEDTKEEKKDSDSISKMSSNSSTSSLQSSSSSSSSNESYIEPICQLTNTTSIIDTTIVDTANNQDEDEDMHDKRSKRGKGRNPTLRLMEMVHSLPKDTYRNSYILKIGQELGANKLLWEDKIQPLLKSTAVDVDGSGGMGSTLASQLQALKSFLGVDGNTIHSPPLWMCDPSLSTNPIALRDYMNKLRKSLLKNVKEWSKEHKRLEAANSTLEERVTAGEATTNEMQEGGEGTTIDDNEVHTKSTTTKMEDIEIFDPSPVKGEEGDPDELKIPSFKPLKSLLDSQETQPNPGGIDKYAKFIHESKIDISNVDVALAWFMAQLTSSKAKLIEAEQQQQNNSLQEDRITLIKEAQEEVNQWNESIQSYLQLVESLTSVRDAQFYKCGDLYPQCAPLATAVMTSQSYIANGSGGDSIELGNGKKHNPFNVKSEEEYDDEEEEEPELTSDEHILHQIHLSATDLSRRGRDQNKHLTSFTPIHLTTGIAMLTEILPHNSPAVELISRPCCPDSSDNIRTPFDLVRNMITSIEEDGTLISAPDMTGYIDTRNKIIDEVLVKAIRDASMVFRKCVESDPEDVNHWSWYVATMLGMLCIAYGSFTSSIDGSNVKEEEDHQTRTPRYQLECFDEIRCNASVALADFLKFTQDHGCPMFHLASTSMLEWDKAILLLYRPQSLSEFGLDVRRLHAYHTYQWATKANTTESSIIKVRQLCEANLLPRDALLDLLACAVEKNPCRRENWVHLVNALGRVYASTGNNHDECLHSEESTDQERRDCWWGKDRVSTWKEEFFNNLPKSATQAVKPEFVCIVSQVVESILVDSPYQDHINKEETLNESSVSMPNPGECMEWIWDPQDTSDVDYDENNLKNDLLPSTKEADQSQEELVHSMEISHHPTCEAMCMNIVVASHLLGVWHPFVCNSIWLFSVKLWQSQQQTISDDKSNAYAEGLAWLKMYGVDASVYIQCRLKHSK